jgi:hypothetical protein
MPRTGSALNKIKDDEYEKQQQEKQQRLNRLKEVRRKYSKQKLKSKQRNDSQSGTSQNSSQKPKQICKNEYDDSEYIIDCHDSNPSTEKSKQQKPVR